ncbi:MAG: universal stress protein, partial [Cyanobacteriota bacterium]|nr:universal stress protein [Cyanobacteriota bacterium]
KAGGGTLHLLHVLSPATDDIGEIPLFASAADYGMEMYSDAAHQYLKSWHALEDKGLAMLRSLAELATAMGIETDFTQLIGNPGEKICELAQDWEADLIVTGSRRRSGFKELFLGSISNYVSHRAPCSVLIVHPQQTISPMEYDEEVPEREEVEVVRETQ